MIKYYWINQVAGHKSVIPMEQDEIAALGASLRQIDQKLLTPADGEGTKIWYQGGEPYFDVFVELRDRKIDWFQFTLRGSSVSWNSQSGWHTGTTNERRADDITFYPGSKLIESDRQLNVRFIKLSHSILQTRAGEEDFDQMLALFDSEQ